MRKWYVPLTIAGMGAVAAYLLSESGQGMVRWFATHLRWNSEGRLEWNETADAELRRIQTTLSVLAESLQPRTQLGR